MGERGHKQSCWLLSFPTAGVHFIFVAPLVPPPVSNFDQQQLCDCSARTCVIFSSDHTESVDEVALAFQSHSCCDREMKKQPREAPRARNFACGKTTAEQRTILSLLDESSSQKRESQQMKDWLAASLAGGRYFWVDYAPWNVNLKNQHRQSWRPPGDEPVMSTQAT